MNGLSLRHPARALIACWLALLLVACGGDSAPREGAPASTDVTLATLSGIASTGVPVSGIITLQDVPTGKRQATHTDDGRYTFNVTGLAGPFLLRAEPDDRSATLYGMALRTGSATRGHVNPLSHRVVMLLARVPSLLFGGAPPPPVLSPEVDAAAVYEATQSVLLRTSPYFRDRLQAHGVDLASLDPLAGSYTIGQGLDLAFGDVRFAFDNATGDTWETATATGAIVGSGKQADGYNVAWSVDLVAPHDYLLPGGALPLQLNARLGYWLASPVRQGVRWTLSDDSLATIDASGLVTAKAFSGRHTLTVTAFFQQGDELLQDTLTLTLVDTPQVDSVSIDLPDTLAGGSRLPLRSRVQFTADAGGGEALVGGGQWRLVDPDPNVATHVQLEQDGEGSALLVGRPPLDLELRLRAEQTIAGHVHVSEKTITVPRYVRLPTGFSFSCPSWVDAGQTARCSAEVIYDDYSREAVAPVLSVTAADAGVVAVSGDTLTSTWEDRANWRNITVTGRHEGLSATQVVTLSPRKTLMTALEIVAVDTLPEYSSTSVQAWATWDDGSRTDVTSSVTWSTSAPALADFPWSSSGTLQSYYILDGTTDRVATLTAATCPQPGYYCSEADRLVARKDITVRNASLTLVGVDLGTGMLGSGFAERGRSHALTARAIWNKKQRDGTPFMTPIASGVTWSSDHPGAAVSGDTLVVGSAGEEPLALITARYRDPNDAGVLRTGRRVITLYTASGTPRRLDRAWGSYSDTTYVLGGDGLARPLQVLPAQQGGHHVMGAPEPFMAQVRQVVHTEHGHAFLHEDGTVWYPEPVASLPLGYELRTQLARQTSSYSPVVPRRIPGLGNVVQLAQTGAYSFRGALFALRADGSVLKIAIPPSSSGRTYQVTGWRAGVRRLASGANLYLLLEDGTAEYRTDPYYDTTAAVRRADGSKLDGIEEIAPLAGGGLVRTRDGTLWGWGNNGAGQLGLGDTTAREHAVAITHVTGFSQLAGGLPAALRSDGTLWHWGGFGQADTLPRQVTGLAPLVALHGSYAVDGQGGVWWWGRSSLYDTLASPQPVRLEGRDDAPPLTLP